MTQPDAFSDSYAQARAKFLAAAASAGLAVRAYPHPLPGRDGEALATDVVLDGPASPNGQWVTQRRNVAEDFARLFGQESRSTPPVIAVAVGADSDNTGGQSLAYLTQLRWNP